MGVNLHVDLETLQLIQGPGQRSAVNSLRFKRGDAARLQVVFLENGVTPATIGDPGTLEIQFGIKPRNQFDRAYLAHSADWSMPSEGDDSPAYGCVLGLNTLQLNSALNIGSTTAEELPEITLMGEITWREGAGEPTSTRTFLVVVENDVNRGTEGVPLSAQPAYPAPADIELLARKGQPYGYASLDSAGKVPSAQLNVVASDIQDASEFGRAMLQAGNSADARAHLACEASLGNPPEDGYILVGNTDGSRSWVAPPASGGGTTEHSNQVTIDAYTPPYTDFPIITGITPGTYTAQLVITSISIDPGDYPPAFYLNTPGVAIGTFSNVNYTSLYAVASSDGIQMYCQSADPQYASPPFSADFTLTVSSLMNLTMIPSAGLSDEDTYTVSLTLTPV